MRNLSLWQRLVAIWVAAALSSVLLLWLDGHQSRASVWLLPYPSSWRVVTATLGMLLKERPLLVMALLVVPFVAILGCAIALLRRKRVVRP